MKWMGLVRTGAFLFCLVWVGPGVSYGEEPVGTGMGKKAVRGAANLFTGWVEIPKQIYLRTSEGPYVVGTAQGIMEGIGMSFARTTAGLYELVTFPVPLPWSYRPLFEPEYVWDAPVPDALQGSKAAVVAVPDPS